MNSSDQSYLSRRPFPAYRGDGAYVFVSYSHMDSKEVFQELIEFHRQGYPVWYDEGIEAGSKWSDEIAAAISNCALFIVFLTPNSAGSENVQDEIDFAISENRKLIAILLEETELTGGMKMKLQRRQAILKYAVPEDEYRYKYLAAFVSCDIPALNEIKNEQFTSLASPMRASSGSPAAGDSVTLEFVSGPLCSQRFSYDTKTEVTLGHGANCDIIIPESTVSGRHCLFRISPPSVTVQDCGSKNGTSVNGTLIGSRTLCQDGGSPAKDLASGDTVKLSSKCSLIVHIQSEQTMTDEGDEATFTDVSASGSAQGSGRTTSRCFDSDLFEYGFCFGGRSDAGPVRSENQDALAPCPDCAFFAVLDGVGGVAHGKEAARYLSEQLPKEIRSLAERLAGDASASKAALLLRRAIIELSGTLYAEYNASGETDYSAALACLWLVGGSAVVLHMGDCRAYILPKDSGHLLCLTKDHNRAYEAIASGAMTADEAHAAGLSSRLTRFVGMTPPALPDVDVYPVTPGDQFLLCSDGLYSAVAESELARMMREGMHEEEIPNRMVQTACDAGARDNVTAQYVMILGK